MPEIEDEDFPEPTEFAPDPSPTQGNDSAWKEDDDDADAS